MIRDRLVVGIRHHTLSEKLQMDSELTLEKAITTIRQHKEIKKQQPIVRDTKATEQRESGLTEIQEKAIQREPDREDVLWKGTKRVPERAEKLWAMWKRAATLPEQLCCPRCKMQKMS